MIVVPVDVHFFGGTPVVDNKLIDWDHLIDVHSTVHTPTDNTSGDNHVDYGYVDYFQDDPNHYTHTLEYDAAREGDYDDDMNNNNHDDLGNEQDMNISDSFF